MSTVTSRLAWRRSAWPRAIATPGACALAIPAAAAFAARALSGAHTIDDAYITFRYARNLAEGAGLVYNPGEWVLGTTTPAWAVLLGLAYRFGATDLPRVATILSAACDAGVAALLAWWALRLGWSSIGATLVGLAWALNPMSVTFASGGMETSLFILLCLGVLGLTASAEHRETSRSARARLPIAAFLAGASVLVRPEAMLLLAVVLAWCWRVDCRRILLTAVVGILPVLISAAVLQAVYGSPLPSSIAAKEVAYARPTGPSLENALAFVLQSGLPGWSTYLLGALPTFVGFLLACAGIAAFLVLLRLAIPHLQMQRVAWQPFALFALLYVGFYVAVGLRGVRLFPWYLVPMEPFYLLAASTGLAALARLSRTAAPVWWLAGILVAWQLPAIDWRQPPQPIGQSLTREQLLFQVGESLGPTLPPNALVAAPEIGALGFATNARILDTTGLVSPVAVSYYPLPPDELVADNAIPAALIRDQQPDVVVTFDAFAQRTLLVDPAFQQTYRLDQAIDAHVWQSDRLLVFRRVVSTGTR